MGSEMCIRDSGTIATSSNPYTLRNSLRLVIIIDPLFYEKRCTLKEKGPRSKGRRPFSFYISDSRFLVDNRMVAGFNRWTSSAGRRVVTRFT